MNVVSLSLCKELYELSGWEYGQFRWCFHEALNGWQCDAEADASMLDEQYPAYDLGYLLRKLQIKPEQSKDYLTLQYFFNVNKWGIGFANHDFEDAGTPEDCAAKLCIELFKQGVLKHGA